MRSSRRGRRQSEKLEELQDKSAVILRKVLARQFDLTKRETGLPSNWDDKVDDIDEWLETQTGRLIRLTQSTVRDELRAFIADQITEGKSSARDRGQHPRALHRLRGPQGRSGGAQRDQGCRQRGHPAQRRGGRRALCQGD